MALTQTDLKQIREVVIEGIEVAVYPRLDDMNEDAREHFREINVNMAKLSNNRTRIEEVLGNQAGRLTALENDVKEIYRILHKKSKEEEAFEKLPLENKISLTYFRMIRLAENAGITLQSD